MASAWARTRAHERTVALGEAALDDRDLRRQILAVLGEVIPFGAFSTCGAIARTSKRSSSRPVPVTASPCCHEPSAPGL